MRRFRQSLKEPQYRCYDPSYDTKQLKHEVHLLSILDNCSQILRDDRIWLRKRVKDNDLEIIAILKNALRAANNKVNMIALKQLQINLRKHINKVKQIEKEQQLIKFKQNVLAGELKRKLQKESIYDPNISISKNSRTSKKKSQDISFSLPRQSMLLSKIHEPIEEEENSQIQSSYPSRSSQPFNQRQPNRNSFMYRRNNERLVLGRRSANEQEFLDINEMSQNNQGMKHSKSNAVIGNQKIKYGRHEKGRNLLNDLKLDTHRFKEQLITFKPNDSEIQQKSSVFSQTHEQGVPTFQQTNINQKSLKQCELNSYTFGGNQMSFDQKVSVCNISYDERTNETNKPFIPIASSQDDEGLFTSPQLLLQCRLFIERNSTHKKNKQMETPNIQTDVCEELALNFSEQPSSMQPIQIKTNLDFNTTMRIQNFSFVDKKTEESLPPKPVIKRRIQDEIAEDIFEQIFGNNSIIYNLHQILKQKYQRTPTLSNIIDRTGNQVTPEQLGNVLQTYCPTKQIDNSVKSLYNYIDLDENGYVTIEDLQAFLGQVIDSEDDPMYQLGLQIFEKAQRDSKVEYWSLYLIKQTHEMKEFLKFLNQFEFEVEA